MSLFASQAPTRREALQIGMGMFGLTLPEHGHD